MSDKSIESLSAPRLRRMLRDTERFAGGDCSSVRAIRRALDEKTSTPLICPHCGRAVDVPTMNLTARQADVLRTIAGYIEANNLAPTMQDLATMLDTSKVTMFEHVGALERKGALIRVKHKARSLSLTRRTEAWLERAGKVTT